MKIVRDKVLNEFIDKNLYDDQSPEAIADRLKNIEKHLPYASKNSVYRYIKSVYGRRIEAYRNKRKTRRWRRRAKGKKLEDRSFIDKRPVIINKRWELGHMEADFIESGKTGKGILLIAVDRKIRIVLIEKIIKTSIENVSQRLAR